MKQILVAIIMVLTFACKSEKTIPVPDNLIPRSELIALLIDLEIMESYYEQVHKRPNIYKTTIDSASRRILENRKISEEQLKTTLNYYSAIPDSLFVVYEAALDSLNSLVIKNKSKAKEE